MSTLAMTKRSAAEVASPKGDARPDWVPGELFPFARALLHGPEQIAEPPAAVAVSPGSEHTVLLLLVVDHILLLAVDPAS